MSKIQEANRMSAEKRKLLDKTDMNNIKARAWFEREAYYITYQRKLKEKQDEH